MKRNHCFSLFLVLAALICRSSFSNELGHRYFMIMYGYENWRNAAAFSHTFAAFYDVSPELTVQRVDISWLPQNAYMPGIRPLRMPAFGDFPGQNLTMENTIGLASSVGRKVTQFGPFEIKAELYGRAVERVNQLRSGYVYYRGLDRLGSGNSLNCVHAVSGIVGDFRTGLRRGPSASAGVVEFFAQYGFLIDLRTRTEWVNVLNGSAAGVKFLGVYY